MGRLALVLHLAAYLNFSHPPGLLMIPVCLWFFLHPSHAISRYTEDNAAASRPVWLIQEVACEICAWFLASLRHLWGWSLGDIKCLVGIDDDRNTKGCSHWIFLRCLTRPLAKKVYIFLGAIMPAAQETEMLNMCNNSPKQTYSMHFAKKALLQHTQDLVFDLRDPSSSYCESCCPATAPDLSIGLEVLERCKYLSPNKHSHPARMFLMRPKFPLPSWLGGWCSWMTTHWCNGSTPHRHPLLSSQWHLSTPESL